MTYAQHVAAETNQASFLAQVNAERPRGVFRIDAVPVVGPDAPVPEYIANSVGVDPGYKHIVHCYDDHQQREFFITRPQWYGGPGARGYPRVPEFGARPVPPLPPPPPALAAPPQWPVYPRARPPAHRPEKRAGCARIVRRRLVPVEIGDRQRALGAARGLAAAAGADVAAFLQYLTVFSLHAQALTDFLGSRSQRSHRFVKAGRERRQMATIVRRIAPDPKQVVAWGTGYCGQPLKKIKAAVAAQRLVVNIWEYRTTITHAACGTEMLVDPHDAHEKVCPHCGGMKVGRDCNACINMRAVLGEHSRTGQRPAHLRPQAQ